MNPIDASYFKPITPKRSFENISDQIKSLIYSRVLKPNDRLPSERELADRFRISRLSVREALRMLEEAGFVHVKQGADGGIFVRELDEIGMTKSIASLIEVGNIELREITKARLALECHILKAEMGNITDRQLDAIEANLHTCEQLLKKTDRGGSSTPEQMVDFHLLLAGASANRLYRYFLRSLIAISYDYIHKFVPELPPLDNHVAQHRAIMEAVKARDLDRALEALRFHLWAHSEHIENAMSAK